MDVSQIEYTGPTEDYCSDEYNVLMYHVQVLISVTVVGEDSMLQVHQFL